MNQADPFRLSLPSPGTAIACIVALTLAGCASVEKPSQAEKPSTPSTPSAPSASKRHLPDNKRPVTINADCSWTDENGYNGKMKLLATQNKVKDFSAAVTHPKHGTCRFAMADFRQTKESPVELKAASSPCTVRMWRQDRQVSVAFSSCKSMCSGDAVDYLWPILADASNGSCG